MTDITHHATMAAALAAALEDGGTVELWAPMAELGDDYRGIARYCDDDGDARLVVHRQPELLLAEEDGGSPGGVWVCRCCGGTSERDIATA